LHFAIASGILARFIPGVENECFMQKLLSSSFDPGCWSPLVEWLNIRAWLCDYFHGQRKEGGRLAANRFI
jgi:hypothetical protein